MDPSKRLTCVQCLNHPYLTDLTGKDTSKLQAQPAEVPTSPTSTASTITQVAVGSSTAAASSHVEDVTSPVTITPGQWQATEQQHTIAQQAAGPAMAYEQQPPLQQGSYQVHQQHQSVGPRLPLLHQDVLAAAAASATGNKVRQSPRLQQAAANTTKKLVAKKPAVTKQTSKLQGPPAAAAVPRLQLNAAAPTGRLSHSNSTTGMQLEITPRSGRSNMAGPPAVVSKTKVSQAAVTPGNSGSTGVTSTAAAVAAAAAAGDQDMGDADGQLSSRQRKRLASASLVGGTSLRGGGKRDIDELHCAAQSQQQWGGGAGSSKMDTDMAAPGASSLMPSRPQSPRQPGVLQSTTGMLADFMAGSSNSSEQPLPSAYKANKKGQQHQQAVGAPGSVLPTVMGSGPTWRDAAANAAGAIGLYGNPSGQNWHRASKEAYVGTPSDSPKSQQQQGHSKLAAGTSKWGPGGLAGNLNSHLMGSSGAAGRGPGKSDMVSMNWDEMAATGSPGIMSTRSSLASSAFDDALTGLHAGAAATGMGAPLGTGSFAGSGYYKGSPGLPAAAGPAAGRYGAAPPVNSHLDRASSNGLPGMGATGLSAVGHGMSSANVVQYGAGMQHGYGQQVQGYNQHRPYNH